MSVTQVDTRLGCGLAFAGCHFVFHIGVDIGFSLHHTALLCDGARTVDAAAGAHIHLNESMIQRLDIFKHIHQSVHSVHSQIAVAVGQHVERTDDTLGGRICFGEVGATVVVGDGEVVDSLQVYVVLSEELEQFLEGKYRIDAMFVCLALLGNTRSDEDDLQIGIVAAQHLGVCHHGRVDRSQVLQSLGIVHLYETAGGRTCRGDEVSHLAFCQQPFVLFRNGLGTHSGFLHDGEAQFGQRDTQQGEVVLVQAAYERRRHCGCDAYAGLQQFAHHRQFAVLYLGLLRAHLGAMSAEDAVFFNDLGMVVLDVDSLHRAFTQTTVTVLALYRLKFQVFRH